MHYPAAWVAWLTACVCGALPVATVAQSVATASPPAWSSLPVPGGLAAAAAAVGISESLGPERAVLEMVRRIVEPPEDAHGASDDLAGRLTSHLATAAAAPSGGSESDVVPLPLQPAFWRDVIVPAHVRAQDLLGALLADRRAALFYTGLAQLDEPTLLYFDAHRDLARTLARDHAGVFAAFGRSVRISEGRLEWPGGPVAAPLWEAVVGVAPSNTDVFVRQLFAREEGRLAYLYDAIALLDGPRQRFALGLTLATVEARRARFVALATQVVRSSRAWEPRQSPFVRPLEDAVSALQQVRVTDAGALASPVSRVFWDEALSGPGLPARGNRTVIDGGEDADAAALAEALHDRNVVVRRARLDALLFTQRLAAADRTATSSDLLVAARAMARYRLAMLSLERLGITQASLYAAVARVADSLTSAGPRAAAGLAQFQGALALIERVRLGGSIDAATASRLVSSLADLAPTSEAGYDGAVAAWLTGEFMPALGRTTQETAAAPGERTAERTLLGAAAGCNVKSRSGAGDEGAITWEGVSYRLDRCATETVRIERVRLRQQGTSLDTLLSLARVAAALSRSATTPPEALVGHGRDLLSIADEVGRSLQRPGATGDALREAHDALRRVGTALTRPSSGPPRPGELASAIDVLTADALTSLAYAFVFHDPNGRLARAPDLARRHDFGLASEVPEERRTTPWQLASEPEERGRQGVLRGSLLGLDVALADLSLWRMASAPPSQAPRLTPRQKAAFAEGVVLMDRHVLTDADRDLIGAALRRGQDRLESALSSGEADPVLEAAARAGLGGWRRAVLPWLIQANPGRVQELFVARELFALGLERDTPPTDRRLDAWGAPAAALTGCFCLRFPADTTWERLAGRPGVGALAAYTADAPLRVAGFLAERRLPASLAPDLLAGVMQQVIDESPALHFDDWFSVARYADGVRPSQWEDLFARVATRGPLVAVEMGRAAAAPGADRVSILSPEPGSFVSGEVTISADVASGQPITEVTVFADGHLVCRFVEPPYQCQWPAGPRVLARQLRVVASRADGSRLADTIRTRGLDYTEVVDVDAVQLVAVVTDQDGRFVAGLQREDFRVLEDGVPQRITTFADERVPVEIVVAVDMSGSMGEAMPRVKESVALFLGALRPGDPVTVVAFNEMMFVLSQRDATPTQRRRSVERLSGWGRTALYDTIVQCLQLLAQRPGRKALVLFTDGDDVASAVPLDEVERRVQQSDAALYLIGLGRAPKQPRLRDTIQRLADVSGGRAFFPDDTRALDEAFATVRNDLENQYLLGFVPGDAARDGRWHTLKVTIIGRDVRVRARQGYRISAEP
jgi:VWFA-related protein